jgi:hypothetical protein
MNTQVNVNVLFGLAKASFSASDSYKSSVKTFTEDKSVMIHSDSKCISYTAGVSKYHLPEQSPEFRNAIAALPDEYDEEKYCEFIDFFGTHYARSLTMGSRYGVTHTMTSYTYKSI